MLLVLILLVQSMSAAATVFAASNSVTGNVIGNKSYTIYNPYAPVNWNTWYQYRGMTHVHTHISDGDENLDEMIDKYYELGYQILAITDHGTVNDGWVGDKTRHTIFDYQVFVHRDPHGVTQAEYNNIVAGVGRTNADGKGMMEVPLGIEQNGACIKKVHVNTFFKDAGDGDMGIDETWPENAVKRLVESGSTKAIGVAHLNHIGEWSDGNDGKHTYDVGKSFLNDMVDLFETYTTNNYNQYLDTNKSVLSGMELVNTSDGRTKNDRYLYDNLLMQLAPQGINIYGYCEDDSHDFGDCGRNANFYILPEQTWQALRTCMRTGTFYSCAKNAKGSDELGSGFAAQGEFPRIQKVQVNDDENQIVVTCTNANKVRMVADGHVIENYNANKNGDTITFDLNAYEDSINSYVRIYLTGPGGIAYLQPFLLESTEDNTSTVTFKLPSADTTFTLVNSSNQEMTPINSNHCYVLEPGTYTYTASRFAYITKTENITVTASDVANGERKTYNVTLEADTNTTTTCFYVPETIYLSGADNKTFQYYIDRGNSLNSNLNVSPTQRTGNVYFNCANADSVTITASVYSGSATIDSMQFDNNTTGTILSNTNGGTISAAITGGSFRTKCTGDIVIQWTAQYMIDGSPMTSTAYTYVFNTLSGDSSVAAAAGYAKTKKNVFDWPHSTMSVTGTVWLAGTTKVTGGSYSYKFPYYGGNYTTVKTDNGDGNVRNEGSGKLGLGTTSDDSSGGSCSVNPVGGTGHLVIDTSRITNFNQVPNLAIGLDINSTEQCTGDRADSTVQYVTFNGTDLFRTAPIDELNNYSGQRIFTADNATNTKINHVINTDETLIPIVGEIKGSKESRTDTVHGTVYLAVEYVDKSDLRAALDAEMAKAYQGGMFADQTAYATYCTQIQKAYKALGNPNATGAEIEQILEDLDEAADALEVQDSTLMVYHKFVNSDNAFETETIPYTVGDRKLVSAKSYTNCIYTNSWTAYAYNRPFNSGTSESVVINTYAPDMFIEFEYEPIINTVSFNTNGGAPLIASQDVVYGENIVIPSTIPEKSGYTFDYWMSDVDDDEHAPGDVLVNTFDSDVIFTAIYEPNTYHITYDLNGGIANASMPDGYFDACDINYGDTIMIPGFLSDDHDNIWYLEKTGYRFSNWKINVASLEDPYYPAGFTFTEWSFAQDVTFTAQWEPITYTVSFTGGEDAVGSIEPITASYGTTFRLPSYGLITKPGYQQTAWELNGTRYTAGTNLSNLTAQQDDEIIFEAVWSTHTVTVFYDPQMTTVSAPEAGYVSYGDTYVLPVVTCPGYHFDGWYTDQEAGTLIDETTTVTLEVDHTLYAHWHPETFTVTLTGEAITESTIQVTYGSTYTGLPANKTRTGYKFAGWWYEDTVRIYPADTVTATSDHELVGKWEPRTYTVDFETGTDEILDEVTITYGQPYGELPVPTREDYWFNGWLLDGEPVNENTIVDITYSPTLEADWVQKQHVTVYFDSLQGESKDVVIGGEYGTLPTREQTGYTFNGWYLGDDLITAETVVTETATHVLTSRFTANQYTVNFDTKDPDVTCRSIHVTYDAQYGTLPNPNRTGYTFNGWKLKGNTITASSTVKTADNHTLEADWSGREYQVTLNAGAGSVNPATTTVTYGSVYSNLPTPTRSGYVFDSWTYNDRPIVNGETVVNTAMPHELVAKWTPAQITVSFNVGEDATPCSNITVTFDSNYSTLPISTKTGYTNTGWTYNDGNNVTPILPSTIVSIPTNHTLDAVWTPNEYEVVFNSNGGSVCPTLTVAYNGVYGNAKNSEQTVVGLPTPTLSGYSFAGWETADHTPVDNTTVVTATSTHTLFATWTNLPTLTVSFDCAGGSRTGNNDAVPDKQVTYSLKYGEMETPVRTGFTFAGWYYGDNRILSTSIVNVETNHTLVAHWTAAKYTVTLNPQNNDAATTFELYSNQTYGSNLTTPTRTGYTFAGWTYNGTPVDADTPIAVYTNHTLIGTWTPDKVTVTLDAGEGTVSPTEKQYDFGGYYSELPTPTRSGYVFGGWYLDDTLVNGSVRVNTLTAHTLVANWIQGQTYTITFNSNDGSQCDPITVVAGESFYAKLPTPVKAGYNFLWWYYGDNATNSISSTQKYDYGTDISLNANYEAASFTVTLDENYDGASTPQTITVRFGDTYGSRLYTPVRTGYTFDGWFYGENANATVAATQVTVAENHTLLAHWHLTPITAILMDGSVECGTKELYYLQPYGSLPTLASTTNYRFAGWSTEEYGTAVTAEDIVESSEDFFLYALWNPIVRRTVSFNTDGGTSVANMTVIVGDPYGTLPTSTKTGYTLSGWALNGNPIGANTIVETNADHTLDAVWSPNLYNVTFDSDGGSTVNGITVIYGNLYENLPTPTKENYNFIGWYYEDTLVDNDTTVTIAGDHELVAHWQEIQYTVTWSIDGNETVAYYYVGQTITVPQIPAKANYTGAWDATIPETMTAGNKKYTVVYTPDSYNITYTNMENAAFASTAPQSHTYSQQTAVPNAVKNGSVFIGWSVNGGAAVKNLVLGATDYTSDITIKAIWNTDMCSVRLNSTVGGYVKIYVDGQALPIRNGSVDVSYGTTLLVNPVSVCGYELTDIYYLNSSDVRVDLNGNYIITVTDDISITATYAEDDTLCDIQVEGGMVNAKLGSLVPMYGLVTANAIVPDGQTFAYWAVGSANGPIVSYNPTYTFTAVSDIKLVAVYTSSTTAQNANIYTCAAKETHVTTVNDTNTLSYYGMLALPADCTIQKVGFVLTNQDASAITDQNFRAGSSINGVAVADFEAENINWSKGLASSGNGLVKVSINRVADGQSRTGRFYITYTQNGVTTTVYSDTYTTLTA